jgi:hypothetical protein
MKRTYAYIAIAAALVAFSFAPGSDTDSYKGYAYEKGQKDPIYTEAFTDKFVDGKHTETVTLYYNSDKKLIAKRTLDFSDSPYAPDFQTEDLRTGFMEGAEVKGKKVRLFVRKGRDAKLEEKTLDVPQPVVIDGGFNQYIKSNWDAVDKGETLVFYFTVPNRLDYFKLRATKVSSTDTEMTIKIAPDRTVVRWIASEIIVKYNKETKRIVSYQGKSNIQDESGSNPDVKLLYPKKGP